MNDDLQPDDFRDPFDRLAELEIMVMGQGLALEQTAEELKQSKDLMLRVTNSIKEIGRVIEHFHHQLQNLNERLTLLEDQNEE